MSKSRSVRYFKDSNMTVAYDDDGVKLFRLPGKVGIRVCQEVWRLMERRFRWGEEAGREHLQQQLRTLLDVRSSVEGEIRRDE